MTGRAVVELDPHLLLRRVGDALLHLVPRRYGTAIDRHDPGARLGISRSASPPAGTSSGTTRPTVVTGIDLPPVLAGETLKTSQANTAFMVTPARITTMRFHTGFASNIRSGGTGASAPPALERGCPDVLLAARHLHVPAEREPADGVLGFSSPEGQPRHRRAQAEGEAVDVDPGPLGGDEVARLVDEDQHAEDDDEGQDGDQHDDLTSSRARSRAQSVGLPHRLDGGGGSWGVGVEHLLDDLADPPEGYRLRRGRRRPPPRWRR